MRAKKWLTIITLIIFIVLLPIIIVLHFDCSEFAKLVYNLMLAMFGSSLLGFIMSLTEYFTEKRRSMEQFLRASWKYLDECRKIVHFSVGEPVELVINCFDEEYSNEFARYTKSQKKFDAKNALISYLEENGQIPAYDPESYEEMCESIYIHKLQTYVDQFEECIKSYIEFTDQDLSELNTAYGNLDFIFGNLKFRSWIYKEIYHYAHLTHNDVESEVLDFKIYLESKQGNKPVNFRKLIALDNKWFRNVISIIGHEKNTITFADISYHFEHETNKLWAKIYHKKPGINENVPISGRVDLIDSE